MAEHREPLWISTLYGAYPDLFWDEGKNRCVCEFACADGWAEIVERLIDDLERLRLKRLKVTRIVSDDAGLLHLYTTGVSSGSQTRVDAVVARAQLQCGYVCEGCGALGEVHVAKSGCMITLCSMCLDCPY